MDPPPLLLIPHTLASPSSPMAALTPKDEDYLAANDIPRLVNDQAPTDSKSRQLSSNIR